MSSEKFISNDLQEAPPISGESVPYKDLVNNEKIPENVDPIKSVQNSEQKISPKPKNKLIFSLSLIGGIFLFIALVLFSISVYLKALENKTKEQNIKPTAVSQPKEATISAIPKQITDKFNEIENNIYDINYDEVDIEFPNIEWKKEF